jgi:hypothetical protein
MTMIRTVLAVFALICASRAFETRWLRGRENDEDLLGTPDISSLADLTAGYEAVRRMSPVPLSKESLMPLVVAVLLPMLAVGATQLPLKELLGFVRRLLL